MNVEFVRENVNPTVIKVIGVGGAGGNAVDRMIRDGVQGVEYIAANTDLQDLEKKRSQIQLQLGPKITGGYGAGGQWEIGENLKMR